jgi:hypothetical protein
MGHSSRRFDLACHESLLRPSRVASVPLRGIAHGVIDC